MSSASSGGPLLAVTDLWVSYGHIQALRGVNVEVHEGEFVVLLGSNGAGKSTLLNAILGVHQADRGHVRYLGRDVTRERTDRLVAAGISMVPEGRGILAAMTVMENLQLGAYHVKRNANAHIATVLERFPLLAERRNQSAGTLSGGQQQLLAIARALVSSPKLLLVDEPSIGLAPLVVNQILETLAEIKQNKQTILLSEQNARKALQYADRGYVLDLGTNAVEGVCSDLSCNPEVQRAYLGGAVQTPDTGPPSSEGSAR
jgi:branched-chain amino acid transport system ATP-binding protein